MPVRTFEQLAARIRVLGDRMLPRSKPDGKYDAGYEDLTKGYVLLAHAEIESYFEEVVISLIDLADKKSSAAYCTAMVSRLLILAKIDDSLPTDEQIKASIKSYRNRVGNNHGIKRENLLGMFVPIGLGHTEISESVLIAFDSFGTLRGHFAHLASTYKTKQPIDPVTQRATVEALLKEVESISRRLKSLK